MTNDLYMRRCLELARNGLGSTYPNPLVGCVIVYRNTIIGEGWHQRAGEPHAEVIAIDSVKDKSLLKEATLFVNLEPCSHHGRTPPCADLIVQHQLKKVVIGAVDSNKQVSGKGVARLLSAGIEVESGLLEEECLELNKRFYTLHEKHRPYIILKWAETSNGLIAPDEERQKGPVWISNALSRQRVHLYRSQEQAILVGVQTLIDDDPELTTRSVEGGDPLRIVIDPDLRSPGSSRMLNDGKPTIIYNKVKSGQEGSVEYVCITEGNSMIQQLLADLKDREISSLIVEGGARTLQAFIDVGSWDEARVFVGAVQWPTGRKAPKLPVNGSVEELLGKDRLITYYNKRTDKNG